MTEVVAPPPLHAAPNLSLSAHLEAFQALKEGTRGTATLAEGFNIPLLRGTAFEHGQEVTLGAYRDNVGLQKKFPEAADADKAQLARSHWWHAESTHRHAGWLATNGLPDLIGMR